MLSRRFHGIVWSLFLATHIYIYTYIHIHSRNLLGALCGFAEDPQPVTGPCQQVAAPPPYRCRHGLVIMGLGKYSLSWHLDHVGSCCVRRIGLNNDLPCAQTDMQWDSFCTLGLSTAQNRSSSCTLGSKFGSGTVHVRGSLGIGRPSL